MNSCWILMTTFLSAIGIVSRLFTPSPLQGLEWSRPTCGSLHPSCLFQDRSDICFLLVHWHLSQLLSSFKCNWVFKLYIGHCHQKHFDNIILISLQNPGAAQLQFFQWCLQNYAPDCGILIVKTNTKKAGPCLGSCLLSSFVHSHDIIHFRVSSLPCTAGTKIRIMEGECQHFHFGNSLLISWALCLVSHSFEQ